MTDLKKCSTCLQMPVLHRRYYGRTFTDPTVVTHYSYRCDSCTIKYMNMDKGTCHHTWEWHTEDEALNEWNSIVDSNNSWYTKEYQRNHPL